MRVLHKGLGSWAKSGLFFLGQSLLLSALVYGTALGTALGSDEFFLSQAESGPEASNLTLEPTEVATVYVLTSLTSASFQTGSNVTLTIEKKPQGQGGGWSEHSNQSGPASGFPYLFTIDTSAVAPGQTVKFRAEVSYTKADGSNETKSSRDLDVTRRPGESAPPLSGIPVQTRCEWKEDPTGVELGSGTDAWDLKIDPNYLSEQVDPNQVNTIRSTVDPGRRVLQLMCKFEPVQSTPPISVDSRVTQVNWEAMNVSECKSVSAGANFCFEARDIENSVSTSGGLQLSSSQWRRVARILIRNVTGQSQQLGVALNLAAVSVRHVLTRGTETSERLGSAEFIGNSTITPTTPAQGDALCSIAVAGALDGGGASVPCNDFSNPESCNPALTEVANTETRLAVSLSNVPSWQTTYRSLEWIHNTGSAPTAESLQFYSLNPPVGSERRVWAKLKTRGGREVGCAVKIRASAPSNTTVTLKALSDCGMFQALRQYYMPAAAGGAPMSAATASMHPLSHQVGPEEVHYGKRLKNGSAVYQTEVPLVRGLLNGAMSTTGTLQASGAGQITLPPAEKRAFLKTVVSIFELDPATGSPRPEVLYQGVVDFGTDWSRIRINTVDSAKVAALSSTAQLVAQIFVARLGLKPVNGQLVEDSTLPYYFKAALNSGTKLPNDYLVPLMNESCSPINYMSLPRRGSVELPSTLKELTMCPFSGVFSKEELESSRVSLTTLGMVPMFYGHQFPAQLLRKSAQPKCNAAPGSPSKACWVVDGKTVPPVLLAGGVTDPYSNNSSCEDWRWVTENYSYCCGYRCNQTCTATRPAYVFFGYKPGCTVLEGDECTKNLSIRFAGYEQMSMAALGCAVTYNWSGLQVSATLPNQGIIPYTPQFGGGNSGAAQSLRTSTTSPKGYGCIPCRENVQTNTVKAIPVDQTSAGEPRMPIFSFTRSSAPDVCVERQTVEVRYFGSEACTGSNNPPGHFCTATNIGNRTCNNSNIAGSFALDVCPGGGFEYSKLAVSWSPLILDLAGNGIQISRDPSLAVRFDIKGKGEPTLVDWPMNSHEAGILVLPDAQGRVRSIRELFGDFGAANGFESLRKRVDSNRDGVIDSRDRHFGRLRLWLDRNRNAHVEDGELRTLSEAGVNAIALKYERPRSKDIEGKALNSTYFNHNFKRFMNLQDVYFYEYRDDGTRVDPHAAKKN